MTTESTAITVADLESRFAALEKAQEAWEEVSYLANPKMPCPECGGAGQVYGGSLGNVCPRCLGGRVLDQPGHEPIDLPPFAHLRNQLANYGRALDDQALPEGHHAKRGLALPTGSLPTVAELDVLRAKAGERARSMLGAPGIVDKSRLAAPEEPKGMLGEGDLADYTDKELDAMEPDHLSVDDRKIFNYMMANMDLSQREVAYRLGVPVDRVRDILRRDLAEVTK